MNAPALTTAADMLAAKTGVPGNQFASLAAAKLAVMEKVPYLQKDTAKGLTYSFASESGLIEKLHPAMRECGLTWGPVRVQMLETADYQTRHGVVMFRVRVLVVYRLTHAASGESDEYHSIGEASDMADKGCAKAMTMAQKYALRQAFLIETGDDPDRTPSEEADPASLKREADAAAGLSKRSQEKYDRAAAGLRKAKHVEKIAEIWAYVQRWKGERLLTAADVEDLGLAAEERRRQLAEEAAAAKPAKEAPDAIR